MSDDEDTSLGVSDGDLSSNDLSDGERGAKNTGPDGDELSSPDLGDAPPLLTGYSQTYIVRKQDPQEDHGRNRQVLFRCGNWCYTGEVSFTGLGDGEAITLRDIPRAVPMLQRQQDRLKFFCCANRVPPDSIYRKPIEILAEAQEFVAQELASERTAQELKKWSGAFHWIDDDSSASTYFELQADLPACMDGIALVASKTYARGLVFITVYQEGSFYVVMQEGEGDQALLDIRFPDVSQHGQGLHIMSYNDSHRPWRKLTLWHAIKAAAGSLAAEQAEVGNGKSPAREKPRKTNLASTTYMQTYVIMKPTGTATFGTNGAYRDVLFRFGSWCYSGTVQLTSNLALADIPHVIPALRIQQSKLDFMCDVAQIPSKSPFAAPLECMQRLLPLMEEQVASSEEVLTDLLDKLSDMGLEDSVSSWFDGDSMQSFFEFQPINLTDQSWEQTLHARVRTAPTLETREVFRGVDLVASKSYSARGVVTIGIWFEDSYYVVLGEGGGEQPLLDSSFPNVSAKGRGYQIRAMTEGPEGWEELRKVSVWQTAAALQQEMEAKMIKAGDKERPDAEACLAGREDGGANGGETKTGSSEIVKVALERTAGFSPRLSAGAGGERAGTGTEGGGSEDLAGDRLAVSGQTGGGSALAQPKESLNSDHRDTGISSLGTARANRREGDRPDRGVGSKDAKRLGEAAPTGERDGDLGAESKHGGGLPAFARSPIAGAKAAATPNGERHHAAAKALTNTKVALPHHLTPMAGLEDKLKRMRTDMQNESGDAPWDAFGRPRTALLGTKAHK